ncbi:MAG: ABC transporter, partial [Magnetospirillum sp.]|nr:ABC transporter [Magnetospirillum sp.]
MVAGLWLAAMPALAAGLTPPPGGSPFAGVPEWLRPLAGWAFGLQRQLTGEMREHLAAIKDGGSTEAMAALVLAAFLYGVFHAIGPGHGKVVIGGLIATRRARIVHGIAASFVAAMVQAGVAVAAIAILAGALALAPAAVMDKAAWLEIGSFAMIAGVGMAMTWHSLTGRSLTGHSGCGHAHHHGEGCCGHRHHDDPRGLMAAAAAVGFRPCSGALLVLLFTWANGIAWVGVAATFAMGIG